MNATTPSNRFQKPQPKGDRNPANWRLLLHEVIFEADTPAGKFFDVALILAIILSIIAVMFESVAEIRNEHGHLLNVIEWIFTILFTIEYGLRIISLGQPWRYVRSFYGLVDLIAILPAIYSAKKWWRWSICNLRLGGKKTSQALSLSMLIELFPAPFSTVLKT